MRIQIEPTKHLVNLDGIPVRVWNGVTEHGVGCVVFVHRILCKPGAEQLAFDIELEDMPEPRMARMETEP